MSMLAHACTGYFICIYVHIDVEYTETVSWLNVFQHFQPPIDCQMFHLALSFCLSYHQFNLKKKTTNSRKEETTCLTLEILQYM